MATSLGNWGSLVIFLFKGVLLSCTPLLVVTLSMPLRKKVGTRVPTGVGENHRSEPSTDHVSMHSEGAESLRESGRCETMGIMATIEDLQRS